MVLGSAGIIGFGIAAVSSLPWSASDAATRSQGSAITGCTVTDGDTLRCDGERIRLLGIDAPELGGPCCPGRRCPAVDPEARDRVCRTHLKMISGSNLSGRTAMDGRSPW